MHSRTHTCTDSRSRTHTWTLSHTLQTPSSACWLIGLTTLLAHWQRQSIVVFVFVFFFFVSSASFVAKEPRKQNKLVKVVRLFALLWPFRRPLYMRVLIRWKVLFPLKPWLPLLPLLQLPLRTFGHVTKTVVEPVVRSPCVPDCARNSFHFVSFRFSSVIIWRVNFGWSQRLLWRDTSAPLPPCQPSSSSAVDWVILFTQKPKKKDANSDRVSFHWKRYRELYN